MKAIIPLVALAIQVATAQSPDSAAVPTAPAPQTISVQTVAVPSPEAIQAAPAETVAVAPAPVAPPIPVAAPLAPETSSASAPSSPPGIVETFGDWQLGFGAGMASGSGFSVRKWFGELDAVQLNLAPYVSRTNYPEKGASVPEGYPQDTGFVLEANVSVGLTWLHEIYNFRIDPIRELKLMSYLSGSAYLSIEQQQMNRWKMGPGDATKPTVLYWDDYRREEQEYSLGSGAAVEFSVWRFSAMLGLGLGGWFEAVNEDFGISGDIQVGTHFRF